METVDRYVSFKNIDCAGNALRLIGHLHATVATLPDDDRLGGYFRDKLARAHGRQDTLLFIHCQIQTLRALFERQHNGDALDLLQQLEEECL